MNRNLLGWCAGVLVAGLASGAAHGVPIAAGPNAQDPSPEVTEHRAINLFGNTWIILQLGQAGISPAEVAFDPERGPWQKDLLLDGAAPLSSGLNEVFVLFERIEISAETYKGKPWIGWSEVFLDGDWAWGAVSIQNRDIQETVSLSSDRSSLLFEFDAVPVGTVIDIRKEIYCFDSPQDIDQCLGAESITVAETPRIPAPTPLALTGLGLLAGGLVRRRSRR